MSIYLTFHLTEFLTTLGWEIDQTVFPDFNNAPGIKALNTKFPELKIERAQRGDAQHDANIVVLTSSGTDYEEHVKRIVVDARRPRYQRTIHKWFQASTLAVAEVNRRKEKAEAKERHQDRMIDNAIRAAIGDDFDDVDIRMMRRLADFTVGEVDGQMTVRNVDTRYYVPYTLQKGTPPGEKALKVAKLVRFLTEHGMLPQ